LFAVLPSKSFARGDDRIAPLVGAGTATSQHRHRSSGAADVAVDHVDVDTECISRDLR
jgi:hypothetical protein